MKLFRIYERKQMIASLLAMLVLSAVFAAAFDGASVPASSEQKKLPVYAVGREDGDKIISISFDAACPAG